MNRYKKWSGEDRLRSLKMTQEAQKRGLIPYPTQCRRCGQTKGIIHTHNHDYDVTLAITPKMLNGMATQEEIDKELEVLEPLCWTCHMMLHSWYKHPYAVNAYFEAVKQGKRWPAVYKPNDWDRLNRIIANPTTPPIEHPKKTERKEEKKEEKTGPIQLDLFDT